MNKFVALISFIFFSDIAFAGGSSIGGREGRMILNHPNIHSDHYSSNSIEGSDILLRIVLPSAISYDVTSEQLQSMALLFADQDPALSY